MTEKRRSIRTKLTTRIRITHESIGEIETVTRDISNTGVFLVMENFELLEIGTIVKGQVLDLPEEAPVVSMEVVRYAPDGIGLRFVD